MVDEMQGMMGIDQQSMIIHGSGDEEVLSAGERPRSKSIGKSRPPNPMNISDLVSPGNNNFANNILYCKSSKNNSITLTHMLDESDLPARYTFEQPKSAAAKNKMRIASQIKSPHS